MFLSPHDGKDRKFKAQRYEVSPTSLADELIGYLKRIDGHEWSLSEEKYENDGILFALSDSSLVSAEDKKKLGAMSKEAYIIAAREKGIQLVGNSVLALQHAMFDLLERLGCRFLTPAEAWTIVPEKSRLKLVMGKVFEQPDYVSRRSFFSTGDGAGWAPDGSLKEIAADCVQWNRATRQGGYATLAFGHTWGSIISANEEAFRAHPEYFRMNEEGERESFDNPKVRHNPVSMLFCPSKAGLKALCAADRISLLERTREKHPTAYLVSMDPNDGSRPCLCDQCKALGNPTDRVLHLANHVAREIRKVHPDAVGGVLIYPPYNAPPVKERIEPNIYPMLATAFNNSGLSYAELARGWVAAGAKQMLVYDYNGIVQWSHAKPLARRVTFK
ncbi:MAG: DUF4838 domain-containing protein, partial [Gammaproteobacteria bacterium]|nr:DUF4838 domain-containing protein [Gammaproteobacteria bacterium]